MHLNSIKNCPYLSAVVALVVGDLDLLEAGDLLPQLVQAEGAVRVGVETVGRGGVRLARHQPLGAVVGVAVPLVVRGHDVQQHVEPENIFLVYANIFLKTITLIFSACCEILLIFYVSNIFSLYEIFFFIKTNIFSLNQIFLRIL